MLQTTIITNPEQWNDTLRAMPYAHILQTWEWGEFKRITTGWQPERLAFLRDSEVVAMASIGIRKVGPLRVMYVPKGPALNYEDATLAREILGILEQKAGQNRAIWLKIDPDVVAGYGVSGENDTPHPPGQVALDILQNRDWRFSGDQVQFRNTICIDLTQDEDTLLANMSQNTRRKVRTAAKKGVTIREGSADDLKILYDLYQITGQRDAFLTRPFDYYKMAWRSFMEASLAHPLIAEFEGKPIAHVILFHFGQKCWYFYGASSNEERNRMPNYALQWEAMKWAKARGYSTYDMWGAPDNFDESDRMWGVYQFKKGFRGRVTRHIGAWDYVPNKLLFRVYEQALPRVLNWMRRRNR